MTFITRKSLSFLLCVLPTIILAQSIKNFKAHTEYLASDELRGRGTGTNEIKIAANYIAEQFKIIGLQALDKSTYFQEFPFPNLKKPEVNVIGVIPAAKKTSKSIVFTAHYDGYGIKKIEGKTDSIHNSAQDNAIGVAALIELARAFKKDKSPIQNIVFIATAGEEFGTYGSKFYVSNPVFPIKDITICLNIDGFNVSGEREDYFILPRQGIDFIGEIEAIAKPLGWYYNTPTWIDGMNTSFDTASFLSKGVPAFTLWTGDRLKGGATAEPIKLGYIHTPGDEINEHWNWDGVEDHLVLYKSIADHFLKHPNNINVTDTKLFIKD